MMNFDQGEFRQTAEQGADGTQIERIARSISGEYQAVHCYEILMNEAKSEREKRQIAEIRNDEIRHYRIFSSLYLQLTGQAYTVHQTEMCPNTYPEGLRHAIEDEQNTVDFYLESGDKAQNPQVRSIYYRIAKDEQQHAVWFLYFYTLNKF
ncbi:MULTISPECIES: ferritin-like domain-containing protein [unclassified Sporolactobacillus]|uniref:ferritin-like domain-containing protein n=1 Tax=unclassified Sporolactobacillus TaxID=2628533 RepID=UPI0023688483|nr:ferritin-like domain-containing protein [Sporolactobacillus sp. CQH2019]MDD9148718.1 ferritin-like domain-containing protein [Sporolactobacillus sp. CQH2019]